MPTGWEKGEAQANQARIGVGTNKALIRNNGTIQPVSLADASATNNSIYYSTDQSKLVYKDLGGTVRDLY